MNKLVAMACLSLASKLKRSNPIFCWICKKMNPLTPLAFVDYIMRRLNLMTHDLHYEFMQRCERILLSVCNGNVMNVLSRSLI
ncbi:putative cyclin [Helianthus anomalus]